MDGKTGTANGGLPKEEVPVVVEGDRIQTKTSGSK